MKTFSCFFLFIALSFVSIYSYASFDGSTTFLNEIAVCDGEYDCAGICNGTTVVDECGVCGGNGPTLWYLDNDGDGLGDRQYTILDCNQPLGYVSNGEDDCDLFIDCEGICGGDSALDECGVCGGNGITLWYFDADGDGFGDAGIDSLSCTQPAEYVDNADDVNDNGFIFNFLTAMVETVCNDEDGTFDGVITFSNVDAPLSYYFCDDPATVIDVITDGSFGFVSVGPILSNQGVISSYCIQIVDDAGNPVAIANENTGEADFTNGIIEVMSVDCITIDLILTSFKGEILPHSNKLTWEISSSQDAQSISLQSSQDGQIFSDVVNFSLESNSNQSQDFEYLDKYFYRETTYYRLLETDINGNEKVISKVISLQRNEAHSNWAFYPNPVKDILSINTHQTLDKITTLSIYSSLGVLIKQENIFLEKGNNQLFLNMTDYPFGVYFIFINEEGIMKKIIR